MSPLPRGAKFISSNSWIIFTLIVSATFVNFAVSDVSKIDDLESEKEISTYMDNEYNNFINDYMFRIIVPAGQQECFYQNVTNGSHIFSSFEVLAGQDRNIDFQIKNSTDTIHATEWHFKGESEFQYNNTGIVSFCLDNSRGRFVSKNVMFQLLSFLPSKRHEITANLTRGSEANGTNIVAPETEATIEGKVWQSVIKVDELLFRVTEFQATSRAHKTVDFSLQEENRNYVQFRALFLCTIIALVGTCQVLFVRRLFMLPGGAGSKPRA